MQSHVQNGRLEYIFLVSGLDREKMFRLKPSFIINGSDDRYLHDATHQTYKAGSSAATERLGSMHNIIMEKVDDQKLGDNNGDTSEKLHQNSSSNATCLLWTATHMRQYYIEIWHIEWFECPK